MAAALTVVQQVTSQFEAAQTFWTSLPSLPILIGHCVFCATLAPDAKGTFLLHFWLTFIGGFAGGAVSSLLFLDGSRAPISLMFSNVTGLTWTAVWWLMTYSPVSGLLNAIFNIKPVKMASKACVSYMRASLIISRVALAAKTYPDVYLAPILAATTAACGGKVTSDMIRHFYGLGTGPVEFTQPTYSFRSAFFGSAIVYLTAHCPFTAFLTKQAAAGLLITLFVVYSVLSDLGLSPDWSDVLLRIVLKIGFIPYPTAESLAASTKAAKATGNAATSQQSAKAKAGNAAAATTVQADAKAGAAATASANKVADVKKAVAGPVVASNPGHKSAAADGIQMRALAPVSAAPAAQSKDSDDNEADVDDDDVAVAGSEAVGAAAAAAGGVKRRKKKSDSSKPKAEDGWTTVPVKQKKPAPAVAGKKSQ